MRIVEAALCLALTAGVVTSPALAWAVTPPEIANAKAAREALQRELDSVVAKIEKATARLSALEQQIAETQIRLAEAESRMQQARASLSVRANLTYRAGPVILTQVLFMARGFGDFIRRLEFLERISSSDSAALLTARRAQADLIEIREELAQRRAQEQQIAANLKLLSKDLSRKFEEAQALEKKLLADLEEQRRRQAEAERRRKEAAAVARRSSPSFNVGGLVCPVAAPNSFRDSWGEPRSGGRRHQGVDIYAAYGAPVVAVESGTILRNQTSSLGGLSVFFRGDSGTEYFYTHLSGYAASPGQHVQAGTVIAYLGNSGNAQGGTPHLHFEIHPGGGAAINPYPATRAACG
jgi:murein DD-endopeptidase MepM/ murein hydrolase activator NlpD